MKILLAHSNYQHLGGEDSVLANEKDLALKHGHQCESAILSNDIVNCLSVKIQTALNASWAESGYKFVLHSVKDFHPDIVHVRSFFPHLTLFIYDTRLENGIPGSQALEYYCNICANTFLVIVENNWELIQ